MNRTHPQNIAAASLGSRKSLYASMRDTLLVIYQAAARMVTCASLVPGDASVSPLSLCL